ncbi:MAG: GNAT family N-acetyltransferase [Methylovirgula sp.]|uniref:GNAT family N-acetyltransferase n=1 Tax=Methylovirgula sp. TaxID=1978224 RepID=UPI0030762D89
MDRVTDNASRHRFELVVDNEVAFVTYAMEGDRLALLHTEVPKALEGRGIGKLLIRLVLDEARQRGLKIVPRCEFVSAFIERNPEFDDVIA